MSNFFYTRHNLVVSEQIHNLYKEDVGTICPFKAFMSMICVIHDFKHDDPPK
ncbi:Hypothetical protein WP0490 [Wolbachia endosymbiont of Culex quinquefasciatus Pel]|nr:Hypothetical protein WP0490 [Wolbachia endosymbiont of Culex quinquefasciatus Pel]CCE77867.1 conserved hypothetical protein [Wolbachia pipientis wAlbB]